MNRKLNICLVLLSGVFIASAQSSDPYWARHHGGIPTDISYAITTDAAGNIYTTGGFETAIMYFDSIQIIDGNNSNVFVTKYNAKGKVMWAFASGGGNKPDYGRGIAADPYGNIYVTGVYQSDNIGFGTSSYFNMGGKSDIFLLKLNAASGKLVWAKRIGDTGYDGACGIATDPWGNIFLTGYFESGGIMFDSKTLINRGDRDAFISKLDSSGKVIWVKGIGSSGFDMTHCLAADAAGHVYVGGNFGSPYIVAGSDTLYNTQSPRNDGFVIRFDSSGQAVWIRGMGGNRDETVRSITCMASGDICFSGDFSSDVMSLGGLTLTNTTQGVFQTDVFLTRYTAAGTPVWAGKGGSTNTDISGGLSTDASGHLYHTGYFYNATFQVGGFSLPSKGEEDIFVAEYDQAGTLLLAQSYGGRYRDLANGIAAHSDQEIYYTGRLGSDTVIFGNDTLTNYAPPLGNYGDIFVTRYLRCDTIHPQITRIAGDTLLSAAGAFYQWYYNGSKISGAVAQKYRAAQNGTFTVLISDSNGCSIMSFPYNLTGVGLTGIKGEQYLQVYPNPSAGTVTLLFHAAEGNVEVMDATGRVLQRIDKRKRSSIDITLPGNGIFIIRLQTAEGSISRRVLVHK